MKKGYAIVKKLLCVVVSASIMLSCGIVNAGAESAETTETAKQAVASITAGWNLGNALDSNGDWIGKYSAGKPSDYETAWGNPVTTKGLITAVKKAGFNAVRVPVTWAEHIDDKGNINSEWLKRVHEVVDYVISQDMYCILNVHHDGGSEGWLVASADCYKSSADKYAGLWKNIAESFNSYGDKLIFESYNEILDEKDSWTDSRISTAYTAANDFNQLFVTTVRKTGGNNSTRNLMVQTYSASSSDKTLNAFVLPTDTVKNHLIVQIHNYDPAGFTYSEASWTTITDKWESDSNKKAFDTLFARLGKFADKLGVPLVVGEFGADYKENDGERTKFAEYFVKTAASYGIKCFWWDTGNMALFDRSGCKVTHSEVVKALTANYAESTADVTESAVRQTTPVVTAKASGSKITLSWTATTDADAYRVYRYDTAKKKYVRLKTITGTKCTLKNQAAGSYKFIIVSVRKTENGYKKMFTSKVARVTVK